MADTMLALQKALVTALAGISAPSSATASAPVGVSFFDHAPDNADRPLIRLERHEVDTAGDAFDGAEHAHTIELLVETTYRGHRQAQAIVAEVYDRLHGKPPVLEAGECVLLRVSRQVVERQQDGTTYTGTITLTAVTG